MFSDTRPSSCIEALESRIAPAVVIGNPLPDIVAGIGKTGATIDLSHLAAATDPAAYHTTVKLITSYDADPNTNGIQNGVINIELFDDKAPLTVQNFLAYVNNLNPRGDYDGTFFHRAVSGFVLQGGGFEATTPNTHIPVLPTVHNEPGVSNTEGTVAMAKVGGDPNSATSEWFVNINNNNSDTADASHSGVNLDTQNGGFTVFGRVDAASLAIAKAIVALPRVSGTETPQQSGQFVKILDAQVTPAPALSTTGLTFTVESISQSGTATPSDLLTASVVGGNKLALKYSPGKAGRADVKVKVSDGTMSATDTFTVDVQPNLIAKIDADPLPFLIVPGDTAALKFHLTNNGASIARGPFDLKISLAKLTYTNTNGIETLTLPASPEKISLTTISNVNLNLVSGLSQTFTPAVKIPTTLATGPDLYYRVIVDVVPKSGSTAERFADDNVALNDGSHQLLNRFGSFVVSHNIDNVPQNFARTNALLKYTGTDVKNHATLLTWKMTGPGFGEIATDGGSLRTSQTTLASTVAATVSAGSAHVALDGVNFDEPIGTATLGLFDVHGPVIASGGLKSLTLGDLTGQALMLIGATPPDNSARATIKLGMVQDFSLESDMPIASLTAVGWGDTMGAHDAITTPSLGTLRIAKNFEANLTVTDVAPVTSIAITGLLREATIQTAGNIGTVTFGGMDFANLFAGVTERPDSLADFTEAHSIGSVTITGIAGHTPDLFVNAQVAAQTIGAIKVQRVSDDGGPGDFGFVADVIKSYTRIGGPAKSNVTAATEFDRINHFLVKVL